MFMVVRFGSITSMSIHIVLHGGKPSRECGKSITEFIDCFMSLMIVACTYRCYTRKKMHLAPIASDE